MIANQYHTDAQLRLFAADLMRHSYGPVFQIMEAADLAPRRSPADQRVLVPCWYILSYKLMPPIQCSQCGQDIEPPLRYARFGKYPACSEACAAGVGVGPTEVISASCTLPLPPDSTPLPDPRP